MATIAAVLIVKNEAHHLPRCLDSLRWADELVVVDDESSDDTVAVAESYGARVFRRRLDQFDTQRNFALEQASCDWVLSIDADEVVPAALAREIRQAIERPDAPDVYGVPFLHRIFGRWIRHGGWPAPLRRLFRREVRWGGAVHERVSSPTGSYGVLQHPILHDSHPDIAEFIAKLNRYTDQEAAARVDDGRRFSALRLMLSPLRDFCRRYLLERGYKDGPAGLVLAMLMAFYVFTARAKAWELSHPADEAPPPELT